jgi:3-hydroxyacyl-CoA dehydrogenase
MTLGGGCEFAPCTVIAALASAETYIGLVEVGVGLIPGGGGTKEMALRASDAYYNGDPMIPQLAERFTAIASAKVATSAHEGFAWCVRQKERCYCIKPISLVSGSQRKSAGIYNNGYVQKPQRDDITVAWSFRIKCFVCRCCFIQSVGSLCQRTRYLDC